MVDHPRAKALCRKVFVSPLSNADDSLMQRNKKLKPSMQAIQDHNRKQDNKVDQFVELPGAVTSDTHSISTDITFQPYTIWILYYYDSNLSLDSQSRKLSLMFQRIAHAVIADGAAARLEMNTLKNLHGQLNDNYIKDIIKQILDLEQGESISIINNTKLSRYNDSLHLQRKQNGVFPVLEDKVIGSKSAKLANMIGFF
ncbi:hypothetical protein BD408DRAFT_432490 [Parasitella parasitica]|nr:hypothetical protein BD408DRAFT_432490 [Parasitella parasitica]